MGAAMHEVLAIERAVAIYSVQCRLDLREEALHHWLPAWARLVAPAQ